MHVYLSNLYQTCRGASHFEKQRKQPQNKKKLPTINYDRTTMNLSFALLFLAPAVALADGTAEPAFEPTLLPSTGGKGGGSKGLPSEPTIVSSASSSSGKARRSSSGPSPAPSGGKASASRSSKGSRSADTEVSFPLLLRRDRRRRRRLGSKKSKGASESTVSTKSPKSSPAPTTLATVEDTEIAP